MYWGNACPACMQCAVMVRMRGSAVADCYPPTPPFPPLGGYQVPGKDQQHQTFASHIIPLLR